MMCTIEGCNKPKWARGMCTMHYRRNRVNGDPSIALAPWAKTEHPMCAIDECESLSYSRGWCRIHYVRWCTHGDPLTVVEPLPLEQRFWSKVDKNGPVSAHRPGLGPCWIWTGSTDGKGYGHLRVENRLVPAHRVAYELLVGPIPAGLEPDHLCLIKPCVNPRHLEPVTHAENMRRAAAVRREEMAR